MQQVNSYSTLFKEEMQRKVKAVPVTYYVKAPSSVFTEPKVVGSQNEEEPKAESIFPGWNLQGCI